MTRSARGGAAPQVAAFFDVDNTIIRGASAFHIAAGLRRRGYFAWRDIFRFGWHATRYAVLGESKKSVRKVRDNALSVISGMNVAEMTNVAEEIYDEVLALRVYPGAKELLDSHLKRGHEVWLVTATPVEIGRLIARRLGATGALGTVAEHKRGVYTGRLVGPMLHGKKKAKAAEALANERGLDLTNSFAYGDSLNDQFILDAVGNPCAINPEPRLRRMAKKRGWPVLDFHGRRPGRRGIVRRTWAGVRLVIGWMFRALCGGIARLFGRRRDDEDAAD